MNSATVQKYLNEVDKVRQGCESLIEIMDSVANGNEAVLNGFNHVLDSAIAKCNTSDYLIKIYGKTLTSSSERLMKKAVVSAMEGYIPVVALALMCFRIYGSPGSTIQPEA